MPKGYPTPNQKKEQVIALAQTSMTEEGIAAQVGVSRRTLARIWVRAGIRRAPDKAPRHSQRRTGPMDAAVEPRGGPSVEIAPLREQPFCVGQQFEVWPGDDRTDYVRALSVGPIPISSGSTIDFGPLGPGEETTKPAVEVLCLRPDELVRFYVAVEDDIQVTFEERKPKLVKKQGIRLMVDAFTRLKDPGLENTAFWLYGTNRDLLLRVKNPTGYESPARVCFYGWRIVTEGIAEPEGPVVKAITRGDL